MFFEHKSVRKNFYRSSCFCWNSRLLCELHQKFEFSGLIGYGNFNLDSVFCDSKVWRLHAILHDAAGAVQSHTGKGPGYCYLFGWGPFSCLLADVTKLLVCLYVKLFLLSISNSVDFWSSVSLIVLDIDLTEKNIIRKLGFFLMVLYKEFHFVHQRLLNLTNRRQGTQVSCIELRRVVESWIMRSFLLSFTTWK